MAHKIPLLPVVLAASLIGYASAATVAINFGSTIVDPMVNQYATPPDAAYTGGSGNLTTSLTGTTGATGTSYNTVQTFQDTTGNNLSLTLSVNRSAGKIFQQITTPVANNSAAINEIAAATGISTASLNSAAQSFLYSGAGGSDIELVTLNNLHDGSSTLGYQVTLYFGASAQAGALTLATILGGTTTSLTYAGQDGSGFDSATLGASGPGMNELTMVKWVGTLTNAQNSLSIDLDANNKAGIAFLTYEITPIPETSVAMLSGLGALVLLRRRR